MATTRASSKAGSPAVKQASARKPRLDMRAPRRPPMGMGDDKVLPRSPTVLLLVDMINPLDFPEAERLAPAATAAARTIARLKERMVRAGAACIYANDNYGQWRSDFRDVLDGCRAKGGASAEMAALLAPASEDLVLLKPRQSAFFGTPLDLLLTQMHARKLVITGVATDICVQLSAMDAKLRGYELWIPSDCTAAESPAFQKDALAYMARVLEADVRPAARLRRID